MSFVVAHACNILPCVEQISRTSTLKCHTEKLGCLLETKQELELTEQIYHRYMLDWSGEGVCAW